MRLGNMKVLARLMLVSCVMLGLAACGGLQKEADLLLEDKNYQDALGIYDRILQSSPSDAKALNGRKHARLGVIEQGLIEVRLKRLSGQKDASLESLDELITRMSEWSLYPEGPVAFTQKEEMTFASKEVETDLDRQLAEGKSFRAQWTLQRWAKLFPTERLSSVSSWQQKISKAGLETCEKWTKATDKSSPFYTRFVLKSCGLFGELDVPMPRAKEQFAWIEPRFQGMVLARDLQPEQETQLKQKLQESFRRSPWYEEASETVLFATLEPKYQFQQDKKNVHLTHAYLVQVPYQSEELVDVQTWVPDDRVVTIVGLDGKARTEVVRDSKRVTKSEMRSITRFRNEVRHIPFEAMQFDLTAEMSVDLRLQSSYFDQAQKAYYSEDAKFYIQHGNDSPEVGLRPSFPKIPGSTEVFVQLADRFANEFGDEMRNLWKKEFCNPPTGGRFLVVSEKVHRCLHGSKDAVPDFAEKWMKKEIGLSYREWQALAGLDKNEASTK